MGKKFLNKTQIFQVLIHKIIPSSLRTNRRIAERNLNEIMDSNGLTSTAASGRFWNELLLRCEPLWRSISQNDWFGDMSDDIHQAPKLEYVMYTQKLP